jgi:hypothetical protein
VPDCDVDPDCDGVRVTDGVTVLEFVCDLLDPMLDVCVGVTVTAATQENKRMVGTHAKKIRRNRAAHGLRCLGRGVRGRDTKV